MKLSIKSMAYTSQRSIARQSDSRLGSCVYMNFRALRHIMLKAVNPIIGWKIIEIVRNWGNQGQLSEKSKGSKGLSVLPFSSRIWYHPVRLLGSDETLLYRVLPWFDFLLGPWRYGPWNLDEILFRLSLIIHERFTLLLNMSSGQKKDW